MRALLRSPKDSRASILTLTGLMAAGGLIVLGCSGDDAASSPVTCGEGTQMVDGVCVPAGSGGSAGTANGGAAGTGGTADASPDTSAGGTAGQGGAIQPDASAAGGSSGAAGGAGASGAANEGGTQPDAAPVDASQSDASYPVCPMAAVDITDAMDVTGYYDSFTSGQGTLSGSCGGDGAGETVLQYVADEETIVSIQLTTQTGQSHLDGVLYVRTQCDDPDSEVACNEWATEQSDPTVAKVPAGPFYIFVDGYGGSVGKYRLTMTKFAACKDNAACAGNPAGPVCNEATGLCVGCVTAFDCPASAAACEHTGYYGQGPLACMDLANCAEDVIETGLGSDDGPSAARQLVPGSDGKASAQGLSCLAWEDFPSALDSDWFRFQVADATDATVQLDHPMPSNSGRLRVYDQRGRLMGESAKAASPDVITLKRLPAGTYYVQAYLNSEYETFTVSLSVAAGQPCSTDQDCLVFDTAHAIMRPRCNPGTHACEVIEGAAMTQGQVCDSHDDCLSGRCTYVPFSANADARSFCSKKCATDTDCPFGQICSDSEKVSMCMKPCSQDEDCGPVMSLTPSGSAQWTYRTCNSSNGVCATL